MSEGTEVVTTDAGQMESVLDEIKRLGRFEVARKEVVTSLYKQIEAMEWGTGNSLIRGSDLSAGARAVLAHFCATVGAHPQLHVNLLGGKPYLNAEYWSDRLNSEPYFIDATYHNITSDPEKREHYGVPEWAAQAYEYVIRKLVPFAPIEKIRSGEITDWQQYVVEVREANWAGNRPKQKSKSGYEYDPDPVGNAEPSKTARTRAMRRTAVRAFPAWMEKFEQQVRRAEAVLEAEYEIIQDDNRAARATLPAATGPQAVTAGHGEPEATTPEGAQDLPVRGEIVQEQAAPEPPPFDKKDAQGKFFATLKDAGITGEARKTWMVANGLGDTTKTWDREGWEAALAKVDEVLVAPVRDGVLARCEAAGHNLGLLSRDLLGKDTPAFMADWNKLAAKLDEIEDAEEEL